MTYYEYGTYVSKVAKRLIRYRRSSMIDESDLISVAMTKLWEKENEKGNLDEKYAKQLIKFSMLELLRNSSLMTTPRSVKMQEALKAYQQSVDVSVLEQITTTAPIDEWVDAEPVRDIERAIAGFEYRDQVLLSLILEREFSFQDAGEALGISKTRAYQRYQALIKKLRASVTP